MNSPAIFVILSNLHERAFDRARSNVKYRPSRANNLTTKIRGRAKLVMPLGAAFNNTKFLCRGCLLTRSYVNARTLTSLLGPAGFYVLRTSPLHRSFYSLFPPPLFHSRIFAVLFSVPLIVSFNGKEILIPPSSFWFLLFYDRYRSGNPLPVRGIQIGFRSESGAL